LLLDEPTNHLDIHSSELLINALNRYEGSYILVSHDRYFISKTANKIWEIVDYQIKEFKGTYEEWAAWKERAEGCAQKGKPEHGVLKKLEEKKPAPAAAPLKPEAKRELEKEQKQFKQLEGSWQRLNDQKADIEKKLASPEYLSECGKVQANRSQLPAVAQQINEANSQYEAVFEKIILLESA
jgi:ATP-binding cassette subfamily F protein 3